MDFSFSPSLSLKKNAAGYKHRDIHGNTRVFGRSSVVELLERIRCGRLRVREPGLLPMLRPSSIDRHIFPGHFCRTRRIYKMRRRRRINTRENSGGERNGLFLFRSASLPSISQTVANRLFSFSLSLFLSFSRALSISSASIHESSACRI